MTLTRAQIDAAATLIKATTAEATAIDRLGALIRAAEITADTHARARADAVNFVSFPDNLAHAIPRYRRTDTTTRQHIKAAYERLLLEIQESPAPGIKPRKIDHNALAAAARPYLLGDFVKGLDVAGVLPRLCLDTSDLGAGVLTYIVPGGFASPDPWKRALPQIAAYLGATYRLTGTTATTITLMRSPTLPNEIPLNRAWLTPGHILLGIDVDTHRPAQLAVADMTHTLIAGTPGMGKSVFLNLFLTSCLHSIGEFEHIYAICGQGIAFEKYRGLHPKLTVNNEPEHFYDLAERLQTTMRERTARLIAEKRDKMGEYILVLVDEWGAFNNPESTERHDKDAHAAFIKNLRHLGMRGRKTGIRLVLVVQEPSERDLSPGIRAALSSILSFRLPLATHGQNLFGEITPPAVPADVRTLPRGRAIFHNGITGTRTYLHIPVTPPPGGRL